jgi:hypothetical protein
MPLPVEPVELPLTATTSGRNSESDERTFWRFDWICCCESDGSVGERSGDVGVPITVLKVVGRSPGLASEPCMVH